MKAVAGSGPWRVETQTNNPGTSHEYVGIYFTYKGSAIGRFEGSIENATWMVLCINAAIATFEPLVEAVAQEGGFKNFIAMVNAAESTLDTTTNS